MTYPSYNPYTMGQFGAPQRFEPQVGTYPTQFTQPQQGAPAAQQNCFLVRPVTSREEAVAAQIDFMAPGTLMPDLGHNTIYFKRFNQNTGASDFYAFVLQQEQAAAPVQYATVQDLQALRQEIEALKGRKAGKKNDADEQ